MRRGSGSNQKAIEGCLQFGVSVTVAVGLVGVLVAAASWSGVRSGGRSRFFQTLLAGFGWHGVVHVASSVLHRGYTPGVVTALLVVIPYSWWAWRRLATAEVPPG